MKTLIISLSIILLNVAMYPQTPAVPKSVSDIPANIPDAEKAVTALLLSMLGKPQADLVLAELKQVYQTQDEYIGVLLTFSSFLINHPDLNNAALIIQTARFYVRTYTLILGTLREKDNALLRAADKMVFLYYQSAAVNPQDTEGDTLIFQRIFSLFKTQVPEKILELKGIDVLVQMMNFTGFSWAKYPDPIH